MSIVRRVLDLSHHNTVTNLDTVKQNGIWGIIHKATESTNYKDPDYPGRKKGFLEKGFLWGAYHFFHPGNVQAQVDYFLAYAGLDDQTLYALDWEQSSSGTASEQQAVQFLQYLEQRTGRKGVVYSGNVAKEKIAGDNKYLGSHRLWLAQYSSTCQTQESWHGNVYLWQYSDGEVGPQPHGCPGCTGAVDTNSWTGSLPELQTSWSGLAGEPIPPEPEPEPEPTPDVVTLTLSSDKPVTLAIVAGTNVTLAGEPKPPEPEPMPEPGELPPMFTEAQQTAIRDIASSSPIASYNWRDRGRAPTGYTEGMAIAYAQAYVRLVDMEDPIAIDMAKANTHNDSKDAISWYNSNFQSLGMDNSVAGVEVLRHLFVLLTGLGMRESSGRHCEGRDMSASNTTASTAEAGLMQTSWDAHGSSPYFVDLYEQYEIESKQGYMSIFAQGVSCSSSSWACYGSGDGYHFQELCKYNPTFAVESAAIVLRNLRQHYGPINRKEAELRREADDLFRAVQTFLESTV
jgi:GH25 family lysozyme M1 (1,4-beta-N-acetylmuramidase)